MLSDSRTVCTGMSRYLERAEHTGRLIDVIFSAPDQSRRRLGPLAAAARTLQAPRPRWQDRRPHAHATSDARQTNPSSIISCVAAAGNLRQSGAVQLECGATHRLYLQVQQDFK